MDVSKLMDTCYSRVPLQCLSGKRRVSSLSLDAPHRSHPFKHWRSRFLAYIRHWLVRLGNLVPIHAQKFPHYTFVKWVVSSSCANADCQGVPTYSPSASSTLHLTDTSFKLVYLLGSVQGSVATEIVTLGTVQIVAQTFGTVTVHPNQLPTDVHAFFSDSR